MYSVLLMMALSGGGDVPAVSEVPVDHVAQYGSHGQKEYRHRRRGCSGGCSGGCHGGYVASCHGGYAGCHGGYAGCHGGVVYGGCHGGLTYGSYGAPAMPYSSGYYGSTYAPSYGSWAWGGAPTYNGGLVTPYAYGVPFDQGERGYFDDRDNQG